MEDEIIAVPETAAQLEFELPTTDRGPMVRGRDKDGNEITGPLDAILKLGVDEGTLEVENAAELRLEVSRQRSALMVELIMSGAVSDLKELGETLRKKIPDADVRPKDNRGNSRK